MSMFRLKSILLIAALSASSATFASVSLHGEAYYSPDSMSSGVDEYLEANAGLRVNIIKSMSIEAGYRYIDMAGKHDHRDNVLADGAYAGFNFRF
ncbi:hypothetical protein C0Q87_17050 [Klebsiella aerogenes]|nr:YfaZ family protein [Klebsiella aerogenes]PLC36317.1 hypothetical protein C0Q87_17050 [Klebsiella aerogenes]